MVPFSDSVVCKYIYFCSDIQLRNLKLRLQTAKRVYKIKEQYMNVLTFCSNKFMNRSFFLKTRYIIGVGLKKLGRTLVPKLPSSYHPDVQPL